MESGNLPADLPLHPAPEVHAEPTVPWTVRDTWLGVGLMILVTLLLLIMLAFLPQEDYVLIPGMILVEAIYLVPIAVILGWRRVHWKFLGFNRFDAATLGIGCGLMVIVYTVILIHNLILYALGIRTQGDMLSELMQNLGSPFWLIFTGAIVAPLVEEMYFRGFLFPGLRQKYGWVKALFLSSGLFALAHVDPASLLPTFLLGCVLAYVYQRSNSLWPGIILHFLINSFGLCATFASLKLTVP
jgi:membrane protease YdiL (CAAX protease family)